MSHADRINIMEIKPMQDFDAKMFVMKILDKNPNASTAEIYKMAFADLKFVQDATTTAITNALFEIALK